MAMQSINPATGEVIETFEETSQADLQRIVAAVEQAFRGWREVGLAVRAEKMRNAARILRARREEYARMMALEMGKPIVQGEAEVDKCAATCEYYADTAESALAVQPRATDASRS
jgi:succinate-semialdehyde dehydrogenase / glutarate-semialdehyde dehydrogenase